MCVCVYGNNNNKLKVIPTQGYKGNIWSGLHPQKYATLSKHVNKAHKQYIGDKSYYAEDGLWGEAIK